ncbi:MAG TPA: ATP-binding protein [Thermoanaerobaculia bacterium]|nr:ATP-binding protein [Thermoanaerobaculia bacterium]
MLHESGQVIRTVCFPLDCVASLSTAMESGAGASVAIIGDEGLVGVTAFLAGTNTSWNEAAVQIGGDALRVPVEGLREEVARSAVLRQLMQRYTQALLVQTSQAAACSRFHPLEQRLARSLLALHDRIGGDEIRITHDRLAAILGTLRPSTTLAAQHLQDEGSIAYTRGRVTVTNRARLADAACECYAVVASEYDRLLDPEALGGSAASVTNDDTLREVNSRLMVSAIREQQARENAERANDVAAQFFATLSHELRTPLTATLGWSDLLASGELDDATLSNAIGTLRRNAEAQQRVIDDMLDLTRLRSGEVALQREPVDVAAAVRDAVASSRPAADTSLVAISVIADEPLRTNADAERLQQLLTNLLSNALKFTPAGGSIEVTAREVDGNVQIGISASGRGLAPNLRPHTFEPSHDDAPPAGELALALRLAIARQLVTLHHGSIDVKSGARGEGTTFTVTLPRE